MAEVETEDCFVTDISNGFFGFHFLFIFLLRFYSIINLIPFLKLPFLNILKLLVLLLNTLKLNTIEVKHLNFINLLLLLTFISFLL